MNDQSINKSTYEADILCTNCSYCGKVDIERGAKIEETPCPTCGCMTIQRDYNAHLRNRKNDKPFSSR